MKRKPGVNQRAVLRSLMFYGDWYVGCSWVWNHTSGTIRLLESLVRNGWVRRVQRNLGGTVPRTCWTITAAGRAALEG